MALTERYVDASAAGGGDGTTAATSGANGAFTWAEMITDINTPRVGYRYNVKQGTYSLSATTTLTGDGTATSPNVIQGYSSTIGDALRGRLSGGALDDSLMPSIEYASTFGISVSGADFIQLKGLKISGARSNPIVTGVGSHIQITQCVVVNTSSNAAAIGIQTNGAGTPAVVNNDVTMANSVSGAIGIDDGGLCAFNRVLMGAGGTGIRAVGTATRPVAFNTCIGGTNGITKTTTSAEFVCFNNTIYGCSGDGIDIVTASTALCQVFNNHITNCGGYGIDFNTSTCAKFVFNNRFRDNTSANYNGDADYGEAGKHGDVTTDTGGAETDFTNQAGSDYSLIAGSPGISKATGYLIDIGAHGTPVVSGGGGGGPLVGGRLVL